MEQTGSMSMSITKISSIDHTLFLLLLLTIVIAVIVLLIRAILRKPEEIEEVEEDYEIEEDIEKYLKEEEQIVVNVLKNKQGSCQQGTLQIITGFSKAYLSRVLSELEQRGIIRKISQGKKNIIELSL